MTTLGLSVLVETGAGASAGFRDEQYAARGAVLSDRATVLGADVLLGVRAPGTERRPDPATLAALRPGQIVVGTAGPSTNRSAPPGVAERGVTLFALELLPRITRAQAMDVLSSQATVAGYKAVLVGGRRAAEDVPAAHHRGGNRHPRPGPRGRRRRGRPAGDRHGRRLGAVVEGVRRAPGGAEQIGSLGARVVGAGPDTEAAEGAGGYARSYGRGLLRAPAGAAGAESSPRGDVVITTAMVPGAAAPVLITAEGGRGA